jgi:lactoylglutathione lyase
MIRVQNLDSALDFFINKLDMKEVRRKDVPEGKFTLVFVAADENDLPLELTYNWGTTEPYSGGENFGHVAYGVDNIYEFCEKLMKLTFR